MVNSLRKLINRFEETDFYVYGSSLFDLPNSRDIDVIGISKKEDPFFSFKEEYKFESKIKPIKILIIPESFYFDDVLKGTYGGFFSGRFTLSFQKINKNSKTIYYPEFYWNTMYNYFILKEKKEPSIYELIKWSHKQTLKYRPAFGKSLTNFIKNEKAQIELFESLNKFKYNFDDSFRLSYKEFCSNQETFFYKYWAMYDQMKSKKQGWGAITIDKLNYSLINYDVEKINQYFK